MPKCFIDYPFTKAIALLIFHFETKIDKINIDTLHLNGIFR
ncbi:hypothetical protein HPNQ4044_1257 [Helicobacter pylori NQ4044]|uniref:Uncharacterized protein n=1 Tax=Helicobacter pylori NQ4044 TaxID=992028 RepID=I9ZGE7_HELPX|nr:hypothetical protein HPB14_04560 [Helicobacter pylori HUP-B14]EJB35368.1 hypothetical protein HPNQ4044_1257 [Helicobacter pylori NQ4044]